MNQVAVIQSRLPMPANISDLDAGKWRVLCEAVFPGAKTAEAIIMALDYCRARKLDPFKRPVNIVPMYNKTLKKEVETVWPSINEVQVTASRTGQYAGMDEPKWGDMQKRTFKGMIKGYNEEGVWEEGIREVTIEFPEYCAVTVYRMINGVRCPFTEPAYWLENYSRSGKSEIPNPTWQKRIKGQLLKVAKAFSIRAAFPEEGEYTSEEMEGKEIESGGVVINQEPLPRDVAQPAQQPYTPKEAYKIEPLITTDGNIDFDEFTAEIEAKIPLMKTLMDISLLNRSNAKTLKVMKEERPDLFAELGRQFQEKTQQIGG